MKTFFISLVSILLIAGLGAFGFFYTIGQKYEALPALNHEPITRTAPDTNILTKTDIDEYTKKQESEKKLETPAESKQPSSPRLDLKEVARHNTADDCYMVIRGKVYNVTSFINVHPGGSVIMDGCGTDATTLFDSVRAHARGRTNTILAKLWIGDLQ